MRRILRSEKGLSLVQAMFVLVVLAVLGAYLVSLAVVHSRTSVLAVQGARAYQAAGGALEWGIGRAAAGLCAASQQFAVDGFQTTVTCTSELFEEGGESYRVYRLTALAESTTWPSDNYVSRLLEARVTGP